MFPFSETAAKEEDIRLKTMRKPHPIILTSFCF